MIRLGFSRNQAEKDAWEVKEYQDSLIAQAAAHHDSLGSESERDDSSSADAGGFRQNYRAFLLALAAYMG